MKFVKHVFFYLKFVIKNKQFSISLNFLELKYNKYETINQCSINV